MSVVYIALPVALVLGVVAVVAFVVQVRSGQFDDLDTPPRRMLFDDVESMKKDRSDPREDFGPPEDSPSPVREDR